MHRRRVLSKAALFTTYDRADERLLVEHLLPLLLKLSREPDGEGVERQYFLLELDRRLKQLHDRLFVVSSTTREETTDADEGESGAYGWIWRSIRHLTVGSHRRAVQHAKLWLLHWGAPADEDGVEYLEIVVSSANLTRAAFKGQVQGAWRACIELRPQRSEARLAGWGVLPDFLRELAVSAGEAGRLANFIELLSRRTAQKVSTFVASVPGTHSRQSFAAHPGASQGFGRSRLRAAGLSAFRFSVRSSGRGLPTRLIAGAQRFEGSPDRLELVWIDTDHPWALAERWVLPEATLKTLHRAGATLLHLHHDLERSRRLPTCSTKSTGQRTIGGVMQSCIR